MQFLPPIPHDQVPDHLAALDICLCYPTRFRENTTSPFKVYEYLACGKAVVLADLAGMREEFGDVVAYAEPEAPPRWRSRSRGSPATAPHASGSATTGSRSSTLSTRGRRSPIGSSPSRKAPAKAVRRLSRMAMTTAELREAFQRFYEERGHLRVPGHSLIPPAEDVSTLFIIAGMQQFKPYFLRTKEPPCARASSACSRAFARAARTPTSTRSGARRGTARSSR